MKAPLWKFLAFAAVTAVLTGFLAQTLGSLGFGGTAYRAQFTDVAGVLAGDDVRIAGVKVGQVKEVRLVGTVAELEFTVDEGIELRVGTKAKVRYRNLVGQRYLALLEGPGGERLKKGGLIPLSQTTPALDLTALFNGFRPLFVGLTPEDVNRFAYEIIQVLQGERGTIADLLRRTASLTTTLADRDAAIGRVVTNLSAVLQTLGERDAELSQAIKALQQLVSGLSSDRVAIGEALAGIGDLAQATSSLLSEARPSLAADISLLNTLAGTLNRNAEVIDGTLDRVPGRLEALRGTASTGSWFNFFLCDFDGRVTAGNRSVGVPTFSSGAARCNG
ncbi:MCE family protein [Allorhizocola rhizosphaerae]|uniref:MCE family protein n=1 Tax=Allorhizocola rhizosphaerae TaxID=1872709 RepID=UPI000E3E9DE9|nr:MCE family protein [Allorhizocola rhizosphaerae]